MGLVGVTGMAAGAAGVILDFEPPRFFAAYWDAVALVCLAEALMLIRRQAISASEPFWSPPARRVAQAVAPAFFAGLAMGIVALFLNIQEQQIVLLLIAVWMLIYGLAMHSAGFFMPRGFRLFGWGYVLCGLASFCFLIYFWSVGLYFPVRICNIAMGALFGGGHAAYGLYLYFTEKRGKAV